MADGGESPEQMREAPLCGIAALNDLDFKCEEIVSLSASDIASGRTVATSDPPVSASVTTGEVDLEAMSAAVETASFLIPSGSGTTLLSSTPLGSGLTRGSPGSTPFPHPSAGPRSRNKELFCTDASSISTSVSSVQPPPDVPFNSPDDSELMEALKHEAKKQESEIRAKLESRNLMDLFKSPPPAPLAPLDANGQPRSRKRRNRKDLCSGMTVEDLERLSNDKKITEYHAPMSINEKEVRRRNRINSSICMLRKIVPGITEDTENTDVYETSAKYILFLKQKVGSEFDTEFLSELVPF